MSENIPLQATITGFQGKPATVFAMYNETTRILLISKESAYRKDRLNDCLIITNDRYIERDSLFDDSNIGEAITAFYALNTGPSEDGKHNRLAFGDKAQMTNPIDSIDQGEIKESGQKFLIYDTVSNAKVAVLAICWWVHHYGGKASEAEAMSNDLMALLYGGVVTI